MQNAHMDALMTKHASLDARIGEENLRPHPDDTLIARLKKEKLRLRDAMTGH
ncbi:MAG TPA: YdcH family protein [Allosphingosinicella sp.]